MKLDLSGAQVSDVLHAIIGRCATLPQDDARPLLLRFMPREWRQRPDGTFDLIGFYPFDALGTVPEVTAPAYGSLYTINVDEPWRSAECMEQYVRRLRKTGILL